MKYKELDDYIDLLRLQGSEELKVFLIEKHRRFAKSVCSIYTDPDRGIPFIKKSKRRYWNEHWYRAGAKLFLYTFSAVRLTVFTKRGSEPDAGHVDTKHALHYNCPGAL